MRIARYFLQQLTWFVFLTDQRFMTRNRTANRLQQQQQKFTWHSVAILHKLIEQFLRSMQAGESFVSMKRRALQT